MVASQHVHLARVPQFVREKQRDHLNVVRISVHIISLEQVLFQRRRADLVEKAEEILELAVRVASNHDGRFHFDYDWLLFQDRNQEVEEILDLGREEVGVLLFVEAADVGDELVKPLLLFGLVLGFYEN